MKKLVGEIRGAFESEEEMNLVNLQQLKYLDACVHEGLRLYPPVPIGGPRQTPEGGAVICGKWVPGGVSATSCVKSTLSKTGLTNVWVKLDDRVCQPVLGLPLSA